MLKQQYTLISMLLKNVGIQGRPRPYKLSFSDREWVIVVNTKSAIFQISHVCYGHILNVIGENYIYNNSHLPDMIDLYTFCIT